MKKYLIALFFILSINQVFSQVDPPDDEDDNTAVPIDGGITVIFGLGMAYCYRLTKKNK